MKNFGVVERNSLTQLIGSGLNEDVPFNIAQRIAPRAVPLIRSE